MQDDLPPRTHWPRLTLVVPPEARDELHEIAAENFRDPRREALRLLLEGIERERSKPKVAR
jgi:hypothetical protein